MRVASYYYLFWLSIRLAVMGDQVLEIWYSEGEESTSFSSSVTAFTFWVLSAAAHIELCHIKVNDFIVLFNSLEFRPVVATLNIRAIFKRRYWSEYFGTVIKGFRSLGFTGFVLFTEPTGAWVYLSSQALSSVRYPGMSNTQLYSYLPESWKGSNAVWLCANYDTIMNLFMFSNLALLTVIHLAVRMAYFEPMEQFLTRLVG